MPMRSLVALDETLTTALASGQLVVPNHRLQQAYTAAFDRHQQSLGRRAWRTARVTTLEGHLVAAFHNAVDAGLAPPRAVLHPEAERLLWRQTAPSGTAESADSLADLALDAWQLANAWHLTDRLAAMARNDAHALFSDWSTRFAAALEDLESVSRAQLPALLVALPVRGIEWLPKQVLTAGFEVRSPSMSNLWQAYQRAGVRIEHHATPASPSSKSPNATVFADPEAELQAALSWARETLEHAIAQDEFESTRIGIAVADVDRQHASLTRALDATFSPTHARTLPSRSVYNISAGTRLAELPIARNAIDLIELASTGMHHTLVSRLVRSAHGGIIADARNEVHAGLPEAFDLATWARMTDCAAIARLRDLTARWPNRASPSTWATLFRDYLNEAAWAIYASGDEVGRQLRNATLDALASLTHHTPLRLEWSAQEAAGHFRAHCERTLFAPWRPDAPVQVLGFLETAGLTFTHLWVTGLDGNVWPGLPSPNPLLPIALQRRAEIPRCTIEAEAEYARATTARWRSSALHLRFSCASEHGDETRQPSPLVANWQTANTPERIRHPFAQPQPTATPLVPFDDAPAPVDQQTLRRRGSTVLRDESACSFQAFARHRLRIDELRPPHSFPDALDRGNLLHSLFERIGRECIGARFDIDPGAIVLDETLQEWRRFPRLVRELERARLAHLLAKWLEIERSRPTYRIESVESERRLELGRLAFDLRIDRVDRTPQGSIVIDYKSGNVGPIPMDGSQPQLLLYALAERDCVGVFYAEIKIDRIVLRGIAADFPTTEKASDKVFVIHPPTGQSWYELREVWRTQLEAVANRFLAGEARVAPRGKEVCRACRFAPLCRIESSPTTDD